MKANKVYKLENPARIKELSPMETLTKAGLREDMVLCDIGAGTGLFSFAAAQISNQTVYSLEISDDMIELLKERKEEKKNQNVEIIKVDSHVLPLDNNSCDIVIMVTVLHELENKEVMMNEIKRILKEKGKLMIIEFHKRKTIMGPPISHRIAEEDVEKIAIHYDFKITEKFSLGENFYCIVFEL